MSPATPYKACGRYIPNSPDLRRGDLSKIQREAGVGEAETQAEAYPSGVEPNRRVRGDHEDPAQGRGDGCDEGRLLAAEPADGDGAEECANQPTQVEQRCHPRGFG